MPTIQPPSRPAVQDSQDRQSSNSSLDPARLSWTTVSKTRRKLRRKPSMQPKPMIERERRGKEGPGDNDPRPSQLRYFPRYCGILTHIPSVIVIKKIIQKIKIKIKISFSFYLRPTTYLPRSEKIRSTGPGGKVPKRTFLTNKQILPKTSTLNNRTKNAFI